MIKMNIICKESAKKSLTKGTFVLKYEIKAMYPLLWQFTAADQRSRLTNIFTMPNCTGAYVLSGCLLQDCCISLHADQWKHYGSEQGHQQDPVHKFQKGFMMSVDIIVTEFAMNAQ